VLLHVGCAQPSGIVRYGISSNRTVTARPTPSTGITEHFAGMLMPKGVSLGRSEGARRQERRRGRTSLSYCSKTAATASGSGEAPLELRSYTPSTRRIASGVTTTRILAETSVVPNPWALPRGTKMKEPVAITAWDHQMLCPTPDDKTYDAVRAFKNEYRDKGPEFVP